jgi:cobalt-zinc-cadmium efflux system protein
MGNVLKWSLAATCAFVVVEFVAGLEANSLALLSDAGHNLTDAAALLLAWYGVRLQSKPPDDIKTYGYQRAGVLAAFVNALTLGALSAWIFYESAIRLQNPEPVREDLMLWVAGLGILLNGGIMWTLRAASRHDINIRSAFVHMLGDALGSVGIIAGAIAIHYTGWIVIDPLLSVLIGVLIVWTAWGVIKESLNILLEGLPRGIELQHVTNSIKALEGVLDLHDLHIWSLGSSAHALSCHVVIADVPPSESDVILRRLNSMLAHEYHIGHTTVQFENVGCAISQNGCALPVTHDEASGHLHLH